MWKQTNLGYLRVDRLGCRLRRLASEGEPSLLDSVLDSTPRENTSVRNRIIIQAYFMSSRFPRLQIIFFHNFFLCQSTKLWEYECVIVPLQGFTGTL